MSPSLNPRRDSFEIIENHNLKQYAGGKPQAPGRAVGASSHSKSGLTLVGPASSQVKRCRVKNGSPQLGCPLLHPESRPPLARREVRIVPVTEVNAAIQSPRRRGRVTPVACSTQA